MSKTSEEFAFHGEKFLFIFSHEVDDTPGFRESDDYIYVEHWIEAVPAHKEPYMSAKKGELVLYRDVPAKPGQWKRIDKIWVSYKAT